ncbi:MAG: LPS assembly protein LptD [Pseudomonadota bacterium]
MLKKLLKANIFYSSASIYFGLPLVIDIAVAESTTLVTDTANAAQTEAITFTKRPDINDNFPSRCFFSTKDSQPQMHVPSFSEQLHLDADTFSGSIEDGVVEIQGNVQVELGDQRLFADQAKYFREDFAFEATGDVVYSTDELMFTADAISANLKQQSATLSNSRYQSRMSFFRGGADNINVDGNAGEVVLTSATYTACPPSQESWRIEASQITLSDTQGWGYAENMVLKVQDLPIFYFPAFTFPLNDQRKSGFLYPSIRSSNDTGFDVGIPYYWNIAPNLDATIIPRILTDVGPHIASEVRYLRPYFEGQIAAGYVNEDQRIEDRNQGALVAENTAEERWILQFIASNPNAINWFYNLDYTLISDDNYLEDFGTVGSDFDKQFIKQRGDVSYLNEHHALRFIINRDQSLNTRIKPYQQLPNIQYEYEPIKPSMLGHWSLTSELTAFDSDDLVTAERFFIEPQWWYPINSTWGHITPSLSLNFSHYQQNEISGSLESEVTRFLPIASLDSAIYLDRNFQFHDKPWLQTLIPRAFFLYVPHEDQNNIGIYDSGLMQTSYEQLFRPNRFVGNDRIGDSQQITLALESQFIDLNRRFLTVNARLGRAYYLKERKVGTQALSPSFQTNLTSFIPTTDDDLDIVFSDTLLSSPSNFEAPTESNAFNNNILALNEDDRHSPYIFDLRYHINNQWFLTTAVEWEPSPKLTQSEYFRVNYSDEGKRVFNIAHRQFRADDGIETNQLDVAVAWPISGRWSFVGRWQNDLEDHRTLESFYGLEYKDCCWAIRLVSHRFVDAPLLSDGSLIPGEDLFARNLYIEFVFGGLANVGETGTGNFLEKSIQGYQNQLGL